MYVMIGDSSNTRKRAGPACGLPERRGVTPASFTFGSSSIAVPLARGVVGIAALYGFLRALNGGSWLGVALLPVALFCLKGCPLCWTIGLIETIAHVFRRDRRD